jgi:hypothetical protein
MFANRDPSPDSPEGDAMRSVRFERGQILPLMAIVLIGMLGLAAFSMDVGYA